VATLKVRLAKKTKSAQCANYRAIALVFHASKILLRIILEKIRVKNETEIAHKQARFLQGRGEEIKSRILEY